MKTKGKKALIIFAIVLISSISMPIMVSAQDSGEGEMGKRELIGIYKGFTGGFGGLFAGLGPGGGIIGRVFQMLLMQGLDYNEHEVLENVFVLSGNEEEVISGNHKFESKELAPYEYVSPVIIYPPSLH